MLKDMVGEEEAAGADLGRSVEMHPSSRGRLILAQHLIARGLCEEALSQLERNHAAHDKETTHLLRAVAWWQRNQGDERDRALAEFTRIAGVDGPNELLALTHAVHGLLSKNRANEASQLLESKAKGLGARTYILSARVLLALGEKEAATTVALNALQNFDDQPIWIQRWLALLFASLDRRADALSVWLRVVPEDVLDGDTYALLQLAVELRRDDIVMSRAASLRAAGIYDEWVLQHELATRERYNLADAWNVADTAAKHRPDDKFLTVRRAWIASRRGDPNLVPLQLPDLPRPKEARGEVGRVILHLLAEQQKFKLALEYAYEVYRCYPRDPEALRCMKDVFFTARNALDSFDASEVTSDSAVRVQEKDGSERWFFMEPQDADSSRNEVGPETVLGKELLGSRIGDTVVLASGIAERSAVVREIVPKYVQRMQHVFDNFEILVPDHPELSVMHVGDAKGGFDFEPLLQVLKASRESAERAVALYGENPATSLQALARMLGRTELEALATLVQSNRAVRCARGTREEQAKIATDLAIAQEVVLDLTAALTVFVTETPELLSAHRTRLLTSQGTAEALERALSIKGLNTEGPHTTATLEDGRLVFVEERPETRARRIEQAGSFLKLFRESVSVVPANKLAAWEPQRREVLSDVFGWHGAEAIALATEPGRVLWSDDFCHAEIATREFHCARVWTQAIALQLQEAKLLPVSAYETLSAKLLGLGYEFTSVSRAILRQCGELSDWSITKAALLRAVGYVSKPEIDAQTAAELAAELVGLGWNQMALPASRQNYQVLIQEALLARKDPMESLRAFTSRLPRSFVLNPFGGNQAMKSLVAWAKARGLPFA
jgi:tetratricopeptide (TPR) repeat protein